MRISLARALFIEPTFLMLDEPTNHLDLNAVIWLDDYLQKWKKTLLIVSHDQDFLNSVCEEILHLNNQKLDTYRGNYDTFKQLEVKKREQANKAWELEQRRIKQLKASGVTKAKANEQVKNKKSKEQGSDKKKKNAAVASGTDSAEVKELLVRPREYAVTLQFGEVQKLQPPVIQVMEATFRYGPNLPIIFDELNFGIDMDSRICVVGNNGSGKSTLIKMLVGEVEPTTGYIRRNPKLRVGIYNQHFVDKLPMASSPVEYLRNSFQGLDYQSARNLLGKFGLEGHAHEIAMRDLSGGQKARVTFCELTLAKPHVLFLDEPTNNLDIESIDALCEAINAYKGGMVVVTHDARLIEATESELWVVEDRKVIAWDGEFDSYRDHLLKKLEQQMEEM
jgi:ATP-binding cassette subfamily F protein 1